MDARLDFEAHPDRSLTLLLFKDVTNAEEIADKIKGGKFEPHVSCLNAEVIPDTFAVHLAAHKALTDESRSCMVTKSLHTELVYNLSGSKHISESLKRFGVGEGIKHLMVGRFDATAEDMEAIKGLVSGKAVPLAELSSLTDSATIQKYYKISSQEAKLGPALDAVCCRMASRDC